MAKIGIKIANGEFYPILDEYSASGKQLQLSTIRDGQTSVQIDLYRNSSATMTTARYLGSIVVDGLQPRYAEETAIALKVISAADGRVTAEAFEVDGESSPQKLEIALEPAGGGDDLDDPDISSWDAGQTENNLSVSSDIDIMEETGEADGVDGADGTDGDDDRSKRGKKNQNKRRMSPAVPVAIAVVLFLIAAAVFLFWFLKQGSPWPANRYEGQNGTGTENSRAEEPAVSGETAGSPETDEAEPIPPPVESVPPPPEPVITPPPAPPPTSQAAKAQTGGATRKALRGEMVNLASRSIGH